MILSSIKWGWGESSLIFNLMHQWRWFLYQKHEHFLLYFLKMIKLCSYFWSMYEVNPVIFLSFIHIFFFFYLFFLPTLIYLLFFFCKPVKHQREIIYMSCERFHQYFRTKIWTRKEAHICFLTPSKKPEQVLIKTLNFPHSFICMDVTSISYHL